MTKETTEILNILENDEDLKFDVLDRYIHRDISNPDIFDETVRDIAFTLEDELRASIRLRVSGSMWEGYMTNFVASADYIEIAHLWLSQIRDRRETNEN